MLFGWGQPRLSILTAGHLDKVEIHSVRAYIMNFIPLSSQGLLNGGGNCKGGGPAASARSWFSQPN